VTEPLSKARDIPHLLPIEDGKKWDELAEDNPVLFNSLIEAAWDSFCAKFGHMDDETSDFSSWQEDLLCWLILETDLETFEDEYDLKFPEVPLRTVWGSFYDGNALSLCPTSILAARLSRKMEVNGISPALRPHIEDFFGALSDSDSKECELRHEWGANFPFVDQIVHMWLAHDVPAVRFMEFLGLDQGILDDQIEILKTVSEFDKTKNEWTYKLRPENSLTELLLITAFHKIYFEPGHQEVSQISTVRELNLHILESKAVRKALDLDSVFPLCNQTAGIRPQRWTSTVMAARSTWFHHREPRAGIYERLIEIIEIDQDGMELLTSEYIDYLGTLKRCNDDCDAVLSPSIIGELVNSRRVIVNEFLNEELTKEDMEGRLNDEPIEDLEDMIIRMFYLHEYLIEFGEGLGPEIIDVDWILQRTLDRIEGDEDEAADSSVIKQIVTYIKERINENGPATSRGISTDFVVRFIQFCLTKGHRDAELINPDTLNDESVIREIVQHFGEATR
jgi:hypothetical protein